MRGMTTPRRELIAAAMTQGDAPARAACAPASEARERSSTTVERVHPWGDSGRPAALVAFRRTFDAFHHDTEPVVSPDGRWIAFTRYDWYTARYEIWRVARDGSDPQPLNTIGWKPDWQRLP